MPQLPTPNVADPLLHQIKNLYDDAISAAPPFPEPENPAESPIDGVEYDEGGFPRMPLDITTLESQQLGQLFQAVEAWYEYINSILTDKELEKEVAEDFVASVRGHIKKELREGGKTQAEADEYFRIDLRYVEAEAAYLRALTDKKRLESAQKRISKRFQMVSREISRRSGDFENSSMNPDNRGYSGGYQRGTPYVPRVK